MDEREVRERLNDAAGAFRFGLEGSERVVRRVGTRLLIVQALTAAVMVAAISVVATVLAGHESRVAPPPEQPAAPITDQAFADSINRCDRLLVTRQQVQSAIGFFVEEIAPWTQTDSQFSAAQLERWERFGGVSVGCEYTSGNEGHDGQVVISAYTTDAPPRPFERSQPVQSIGDEASFLPWANGAPQMDEGAEGATSLLEVRSGDLILRFNAGVFDLGHVGMIGAELPALRQLAEDALATLNEV